MNLLNKFPWPSLPGSEYRPTWNGHNFDHPKGGVRVLSYESESSHWSDALTQLHESEAGSNHPIDLASRRLAIASMKSINFTRDNVIIDVGCSSGYVLEELRAAFPGTGLIGADYLHGPLESLAKRMLDIPIMQFDLRKCPLEDACVDGVTCLNVLEHIDDHEAALGHIYRILKPGGIAHIEVPANPNLYDIYDEHLMHHRRYHMGDLEALIQRSGFHIKRATHLGFFAYPAFWLIKKINRRKLKSSIAEKARLVAEQIRKSKVNGLFAATVRLETALGKKISYPYGIRCVVVLKK